MFLLLFLMLIAFINKTLFAEQISRNEGAKYTWFSESIELRGISSEGLKHIVEFMYTGKLPISMQSVQNILAVARHMKVEWNVNFS